MGWLHRQLMAQWHHPFEQDALAEVLNAVGDHATYNRGCA